MPFKNPDLQREYWRIWKQRDRIRRKLKGFTFRGKPIKSRKRNKFGQFTK